MTTKVSREDMDRVKVGDWVRVRYGSGDNAFAASGRVTRTHTGDGLEIKSPLTSAGAAAYLTLNAHIYPSEIVEHRPAPRTLAVGDVVECDEVDRVDWDAYDRVVLAAAADDIRGYRGVVWLAGRDRGVGAVGPFARLSTVAPPRIVRRLDEVARYRVLAVESV